MAFEDRSTSGIAVPTQLSASITNVATSFETDEVSGYPDGTSGPFFIQIASEVIKCSSRAGHTFTVQTVPVSGRGWDQTTATAHGERVAVNLVFTATDADEANQHYSNPALDHHTNYLTNARHDSPSRHGIANLPVGGTPSTSSVGDTSQTGVSTTLAKSDHKHAREGFGSPVTAKSVNADGVATSVPRSDHVHAGGIQVIANAAARPASPVNGTVVIEQDTGRMVGSNGTTWERMGAGYRGASRTGAYVARVNPYGPIPDGGASSYVLPWDIEMLDSDNFTPTPDGTTTSALTCPGTEQEGVYIVSAYFVWASIIGARSYIEILHGFTGPSYNQHRVPIGLGEDRGCVSTLIEYAAGDTIRLGIWQNSGAPVNVLGASLQLYRLFA